MFSLINRLMVTMMTIVAVLCMTSTAAVAGYRVREGHRHAHRGHVQKVHVRSTGRCAGGRCG
jgi:hypothetical protein